MEASRPSSASWSWLFPLVVLVLPACASGSDAVEKRLSAMREEIRQLQNDNDRVNERLEALELQKAQGQAAAAASGPVPGDRGANGEKGEGAEGAELVSRPRLKVVRLSPDEPAGEGQAEGAPNAPAAEDKAPRVILKGQGKELELKQGG